MSRPADQPRWPGRDLAASLNVPLTTWMKAIDSQQFDTESPSSHLSTASLMPTEKCPPDLERELPLDLQPLAGVESVKR